MIELPGPDPKKLEAMLGQKPLSVSGGKVIVFSHGWAIDIAAGGKAHYYRLSTAQNARAVCGHSMIPTVRLYGAGTVPRCRTCSKKAKSK